MTNKSNLPNRVDKARAAARFTKVLSRTKDGKANTIQVPGTSAKRYHIILRRVNQHTLSTECRLETGRIGHVDCRGNSNGTVCYHSFAAILTAADGHKVSFCANIEDAQRLKRLNGGIIGRLISHQGMGGLYFVVH